MTTAEALAVSWPNKLRMTRKRAKFIRSLRTEEDYSWRRVAAACAEEFKGGWGSNQLAGMELCERAALYFGENYMEPPWN